MYDVHGLCGTCTLYMYVCGSTTCCEECKDMCIQMYVMNNACLYALCAVCDTWEQCDVCACLCQLVCAFVIVMCACMCVHV